MENKISLQRIEEVLAEQNMNEQDIENLTQQLKHMCPDGYLDYEEFVTRAF